MCDAHQVIVNYIGEVVGRHAVALQQDLVVKCLVLHGDLAINQIVESGGSFMRHLLTNHVWLALGQVFLHFLSAQVAAVADALKWVLLGLFVLSGILLSLGTKTIISRPLLDEFHGVFLVDGLTLALDVRTVVTAYIWTFVVVDVGCFQRLVNHAGGIFHIAFLIGILNTEHELSILRFSEKVSIQGGSEVADMHIARRTRGKSCSDCHSDKIRLQI